MRRLFHPLFVGFYRRYALRFFRQRRALLLLVVCCLGRGSVASAQVPTWTSNGPGGGIIEPLAIDPATPTIICAGGGGVFQSTDGGGSWSAVNSGLTATNVFALAIEPTNSTPYAGTFGGGVFVFQ